MNAMKREPIFWLTTSDPRNGAAERERVIMVDGEPRVEKIPQHGHQGDYENRSRAPGVRYIKVVRHEGHTVALLLTNAAAHLDPTTGYGNYMRSKARALGWYPEGACPLALLAAGEISANQLASEELRAPKAQACAARTSNQANPCKHDLAERAARAVKWGKKQRERAAAFATDADRYAKELREANKEMVVDVANAVAAKLVDAVRPPPDARQPSK